MAKVALIGASGNAGSRILAELLARGHEVTAIARHPEKIAPRTGVTAVAGDVLDPALAEVLRGHDAVISTVPFIDSNPKRLVAAVRAAGVARYLVVGGAGSLQVAPGQLLILQPDFLPEWRPEAAAGFAFLEYLRQVADLDWTYLSPAAWFHPGERTGTFRLGKDELIANDNGSAISFEDYAVALVDEVETPRHIRARFSVGY